MPISGSLSVEPDASGKRPVRAISNAARTMSPVFNGRRIRGGSLLRLGQRRMPTMVASADIFEVDVETGV